MNNRKELILDQIKKAGMPTDADRKELDQLLRNVTLQRMLFGVLRWSDEALEVLGGADLTTEEGVKNAIKLQARAFVLSSIVEELVTFATTEPQPDVPQKESNQ